MKFSKKDIAKNLGSAFDNVGGLGKKAAKNAQKAGLAAQKGAIDIAHKAGKGAQKNALVIAQKVIDEKAKSLKLKYDPVYLNDFAQPDFNLPNVIMIVDDATSKFKGDINNGAIGYRSTVKDLEIFVLYDEFIRMSGLSFVPTASCDSLYYVDPHNRRRFCQMESFFEKMQESRLAELQHIAHYLGARRYTVELQESTESQSSKKKNVSGKVKKGPYQINNTMDQEVNVENRVSKKCVATAEFSGVMQPTRPELLWFALDDNIKNLINMRCSGEATNQLKSYDVVFKGTQYSSIGKTTANKIDAAASKIGAVSMGFSVKSKVSEERKQSLIFHVEFA